MHNPIAIHLDGVSKIFKLHGSQSDQLIDVLGLQRFGFKTKSPFKEFVSLNNISLQVARGNRIGIIGRNGAGKTTLLKLICKNFSPTAGRVEVNGTVQALMNVGLGFHPDYTGRENVQAALQYNGLSKVDFAIALNEIIDFCELGDFLDQPFKTYSLGMQARLMFAAATAINPDILIVDEVLGAGDAYFIAKSKLRVEKLVNSGCTMLLVSHSMQQILELCDEAIWLDNGQIRMRGDSFSVVKAYEEYLFGVVNPDSNIKIDSEVNDTSTKSDVLNKHNQSSLEENHEDIVLDIINSKNIKEINIKDYPYIALSEYENFPFQAPGGISRWASDIGVKISGFGVVNEAGLTNKLLSLKKSKIIIVLKAEVAGEYSCRYGVVIDDLQGRNVTRIFSPIDHFAISENQRRVVEMILSPLLIGPGEYVVGISIHGESSLEAINQAKRYDLLSRSFQFSVEIPDSMAPTSANFFHDANWNFLNEKAQDG